MLASIKAPVAVAPQRASRIKKELVELLKENDGFGVSNKEEVERDYLETPVLINFVGPSSSPFAERHLELLLSFPPKYPFEPPMVQFMSSIYHPNVDGEGRVCLDLLKIPPKGSWRPTVSLISLLASIRLLLAEPNPDDPLVPEAAREFVTDPALYYSKASGGKIAITKVTKEQESATSSSLLSISSRKKKRIS